MGIQVTTRRLSAGQQVAEFDWVLGREIGIPFGEADQVEFVLLAFAEAAAWIAVCPEFALRDVHERGDLRADSQNFRLDGSGEKGLVALIGRELDAELALGRLRVKGMGVSLDLERLLLEERVQRGKVSSHKDNIGVQCVNRLDVTVDGKTPDEAIGTEGLASLDQAREIGGSPLSRQIVGLLGGHSSTIQTMRRVGKTSLPAFR
jgi:hypothetical protein